MAFVTILTPTYNRASKLHILYESLVSQSDKDFEWFIVDDGSEDDTGKIVNDWISESIINIKYIKKENGGKHTALNLGIAQIFSEWTFIVDSDDYLTKDAIAIIKNKADVDDAEDICGLAFLRQSKNGNYLTNKLVPEDGWKDDFCHCRYGLKIKGDMAEVWKTKCLKEFPFPVFDGEKFCSEDVIWIKLAKYYKMRFYNTAIYLSDYLEDGLTKTRRKMNYNSPKGVMNRGAVQLEASLPFMYKCRAMIYYQVYGKIAGYTNLELFKKTHHKSFFIIMFLVSRVAYRKLVK